MRIISFLVSLPLLWTMLFPQSALAAETVDANETQINLKTQENISIINGIVYDNSNLQSNVPYAFPGYEPVKTPEEIKREKTFEKWKTKQARLWQNLPKGKFVINASAYTAAADECGKSDGITASGLKVKENRTLACPPQFPFGTKIKIEGYGTYVCEDRGGAIKGNHFDIYMRTKKQAFAFGRRHLFAEVVN